MSTEDENWRLQLRFSLRRRWQLPMTRIWGKSPMTRTWDKSPMTRTWGKSPMTMIWGRSPMTRT